MRPRCVAGGLLFATIAYPFVSQSAFGAEQKALMYDVGASFLSAPQGGNVPFAEEGIGFTGEFLYFPVPWAATGVEFGWHTAGFDRDAFFGDIGGGYDSKLSTSSYTMFEWAFMVRVEPGDLGEWHPFLSGGISIMSWHEKYSYNDLSWGPWFPSGTLVEADYSRNAPAWVAGGGMRYESENGVGFFVEVQQLFASGDDIDGRWTRLRGGISWQP